MVSKLGAYGRARSALALTVLAVAVLAACAGDDPATVTPGPPPLPTGQVVDIPVDPPPGSNPSVPVAVPPLLLTETAFYADPSGLFSMQVPIGWIAQEQPVSTGDVRLGVLFPSPDANGLITVTQFDNGSRPLSLGSTANQVLELSGVMERPGYLEISRANVIEREGDAMRVELVYQRGDGVPMHSLVLFQIDNTTFSMVNVSVEASSWQSNLGWVHDLLKSYRVPAAPAPG